MADKKKRTPAVPARGTEVTLVAEFPRPAGWLRRGTTAGNAKEIALMKAGTWHPTTDDFMDVATVPNRGQKRTEIFNVKNLGEMLGAILDLDKDSKPRRPERSLLRLNLISHGTPLVGSLGGSLYGLSGRIAENGDCFIDSAKSERLGPEAPMLGGIDLSTIDWLNGTGQSIRDECRARFREDGEIGLVLCNGGGTAFSILSQTLIGKLGAAFNVLCRGYDDEIVYESTFDEAKSVFVTRNETRIKSPGKSGGVGYFCAVKVPKALAGEHLKFTHDEPKPAKPTP